ncbi:Uncharacterized protein YjbI, contains pentapeptide repeats [Jatrophihabitans endophyticus]|uniref:Uncharacterized protein YjbI, contains pentapeptide repeats n=1 Tax=Jatrophihabitans endophyticus TaxID=1206085 RepID=A0A1M5DCB6_9ACTN|nr:pentapeptide repeat-containing protein [Jatrophihabitans endophyticus]SHF64649.1 Uncharacterized protein YjbI, contains pentapeptide repeats [Jatrophihabitans endophyticus]
MTGAEQRRAELRADCANCAGLCCVALAFDRPNGFAFDKAPGDPCTHLRDDFRCGIHGELRERGFPGCTVFDCQGAGQKATRVTFAGHDWRTDPDRDFMFATFQVLRPLHELLWYLHDALERDVTGPLHAGLADAYDRVATLTNGSADAVMATDVAAERDRIGDLLARTSELVRADARGGRPPGRIARRARPRADLAGADLAGADLRGANLRGARLLAADLRDADLRGADVIGADLRDADVRGAELSTTLFLTQFQVSATRGDAATAVPGTLSRPAHWAGSA